MTHCDPHLHRLSPGDALVVTFECQCACPECVQDGECICPDCVHAQYR